MYDQSSHDLPTAIAQTLYQQMGQSNWFIQLLSQLKTLQSLQALFDEHCPLELTGRCRVLGIKERCLVVELDNANWATQLQYRTRELIAALSKYPEFQGLKKIQPRLSRVALPSSHIPLLADRAISVETAKTLRQIAEQVAEPALKSALLKLAGADQ